MYNCFILIMKYSIVIIKVVILLCVVLVLLINYNNMCVCLWQINYLIWN